MIGKTLAHYEITELIGRGGMGEVYRARDMKLDREVAIKVLPREMSEDPERVARFRREARTLATLQHDNIASIYGFEDTPEARFLVMELIAGEDLSERMARGTMPIEDVTSIALQIARGLEEAHERGVVHRDLKPANVKLTPEGKAKILDFGLARAYAGDSPEVGDPAASPTITAAMTQAGTILGTAAYMSPEQARGKYVDKRADLWSFGVILWEMLSGRRLFEGETVSDTLAMVMRDEIDLAKLPAELPEGFRWLLKRCLQRDPAQRLRDAGEARWILSGGRVPSGAEPVRGTGTLTASRNPWLWIALALCAAVVTLGILLGRADQSPAVAQHGALTRFALETESELDFLDDAPKLSPDGSKVVYATEGQLWLHDLGELAPQRILIESEEARAPFWAPDGSRFAYFSAGGGAPALWRYDLASGRSHLITLLPGGYVGGLGGSWGEDGRIVFSRGGTGLFAVDERGGDASEYLPITAGSQDYHEPEHLPGPDTILMMDHRSGVDGGGNLIVAVRGGERRTLHGSATNRIWNAVYSPTGHILYHRTPGNGGIWALPFSLQDLRATGEPFLLEAGASLPDVGRNGDFVFVIYNDAGTQRVAWFDPATGELSTSGESYTSVHSMRFSPSGDRLAFVAELGADANIWIHDLVDGSRREVPAVDGVESEVDWVSETELIFVVRGSDTIYCQDVGAGTPARAITTGDRASVIPGTREILFRQRPDGGLPGYYRLSVDDPTASSLIAEMEFPFDAAVNATREAIAFVTRDTRGDGVVVSRFPEMGGRWTVPSKAAAWVRWGPDGRLYWREGPRTIMAVTVSVGDQILIGEPEVVLQSTAMKGWGSPAFDVHRDGRIVFAQFDRGDEERRRIVVVRNPQSLLERAP